MAPDETITVSESAPSSAARSRPLGTSRSTRHGATKVCTTAETSTPSSRNGNASKKTPRNTVTKVVTPALGSEASRIAAMAPTAAAGATERRREDGRQLVWRWGAISARRPVCIEPREDTVATCP